MSRLPALGFEDCGRLKWAEAALTNCLPARAASSECPLAEHSVSSSPMIQGEQSNDCRAGGGHVSGLGQNNHQTFLCGLMVKRAGPAPRRAGDHYRATAEGRAPPPVVPSSDGCLSVNL
ncbi:unnamed protein product [Gadus morhua 'NCC']